jgi:hypothetical protein
MAVGRAHFVFGGADPTGGGAVFGETLAETPGTAGSGRGAGAFASTSTPPGPGA